jgi:hypothetical protein
MRLSPLSQVRSAITGKHRFPVAVRQIQGESRRFLPLPQLKCVNDMRGLRSPESYCGRTA